MLLRPRATGFDLDGTLIDSAPDIAGAGNAMLAALHLPELPESRYPDLVGDGVEELVRRALAASSGEVPTADACRRAHELYRAHYRVHLFERTTVFPGVLEGLRALQEAGVPACVITNKAAEFVAPILAAAGLSQYVTFALSPRHAAERKPSPALLLAACERLGIEPAQFLYVGDSRADVLSARAARCRVVGVSYGYQAQAVRELKPDALVASLGELPALFTNGT